MTSTWTPSRPGDWRPKRVEPDAARAAVEEAAAGVEAAKGALAEAVEVIHALADRRMPDRITDPSAERRVLGWLCSGRAELADVSEIEPSDIADPLRRVIYQTALVAVELHRSGGLGDRRPSRSFLDTMLRGLHPELGDDLMEEVEACPVPARCPAGEIALVAALGRAWGASEDRFLEREAVVMEGIDGGN